MRSFKAQKFPATSQTIWRKQELQRLNGVFSPLSWRLRRVNNQIKIFNHYVINNCSEFFFPLCNCFFCESPLVCIPNSVNKCLPSLQDLETESMCVSVSLILLQRLLFIDFLAFVLSMFIRSRLHPRFLLNCNQRRILAGAHRTRASFFFLFFLSVAT